jgi:hypothetical protein
MERVVESAEGCGLAGRRVADENGEREGERRGAGVRLEGVLEDDRYALTLARADSEASTAFSKSETCFAPLSLLPTTLSRPHMSSAAFQDAVAFVGSSSTPSDNTTKLRVRPRPPLLLIFSLTPPRSETALRPLQDRYRLNSALHISTRYLRLRRTSEMGCLVCTREGIRR